jgi:photosystem II stability/assembly factor-like uncharacterized protein
VTRVPAVLIALVLVSACSGGGGAKKAVVLPTPTPEPVVTATDAPPTTAPPTAAPTASPASQGPVGGPVPAKFVPSSVTFISTDTGWALGQAPCSTPPCTSVVRTRDGGKTWRGIPAPVAQLRGLRFTDLLHGYAFGDQLFTTSDGGAHWTRQPSVKIASLEVGHGKVWAIAEGHVLTGPVGGALTSFMDLPKGVGGSVVLHGAAVFFALAKLDTGSTQPIVAVSTDGSPSFQRYTPPCSDSQLPDLAAVSDTQLSLVCQEAEGSAGQQPKHFYTSTTGGRTWSARLADPAQIIGTTVAATASATFVGNSRTGIEVTRDGGRTWAASLRSEAGCSYVGFVSSTVGEALVGEQLRLTHDAGRTWSVARF